MTTVQSVFRYPVKSMLGVGADVGVLQSSGLLGDRRWAVVDDSTGKVASAKQPRLWRRLLQVRVQNEDETAPVVLELPDGTRREAGTAGADAALSRFLGRSVVMQSVRRPGAEIERAVPDEVLEHGTDAEVAVTHLELSQQTQGHGFVDYAPVHLVTTSSLDAVATVTGRRVDPRVLRPNLVLSTPDASGFAENDWVGARLTLGERVELRVLLPTPRCAVPTLQHGDVAADPDVLRALVQHNRIPVDGFGVLPAVGVYAEVVVGGTVRAGDPVQVHRPG